MNNWFFCSEHSNAKRRCLPELRGYPGLSKLVLATDHTTEIFNLKTAYVDDTEICIKVIERLGWSLLYASQCQHGQCRIPNLTFENNISWLDLVIIESFSLLGRIHHFSIQIASPMQLSVCHESTANELWIFFLQLWWWHKNTQKSKLNWLTPLLYQVDNCVLGK